MVKISNSTHAYSMHPKVTDIDTDTGQQAWHLTSKNSHPKVHLWNCYSNQGNWLVPWQTLGMLLVLVFKYVTWKIKTTHNVLQKIYFYIQ